MQVYCHRIHKEVEEMSLYKRDKFTIWKEKRRKRKSFALGNDLMIYLNRFGQSILLVDAIKSMCTPTRYYVYLYRVRYSTYLYRVC